MRKDDLVIMLLSLVPTLLVTAWVAAADPSLTQWLQLAARAPPTPRDDMTVGEEGCPPCRMIFGKAVPSRYSGRLMQIVEVKQRGEPKSGTSFMLEWAAGALEHACDYLAETFGEQHCRMRFTSSIVDGEPLISTASLVFEPRFARRHSRCPCTDVHRVKISVVKVPKHVLPVQTRCPWYHGDNIAEQRTPCRFRDGSEPRNYEELARCMKESYCKIVDRRLQMAIFRDPRPMTVSSYFYLQAHHENPRFHAETVDNFVIRMLPTLCQWVAIRYTLFTNRLREQSELFFYEDAFADPAAWHRLWFDFVGLRVPDSVVQDATNASVRQEFSFPTKGGLDKHPGSHTPEAAANATRSYTDDLQQDTVNMMDDIARQWLPPALLEKFGLEKIAG